MTCRRCKPRDAASPAEYTAEERNLWEQVNKQLSCIGICTRGAEPKYVGSARGILAASAWVIDLDKFYPRAKQSRAKLEA
jgi:hypothetical protein